MSISAEFAVGSSGAPVFNSKGNVVGVVSTTYPLSASKNPQMIVKEMIPVSSLKKLIKRMLS
ncbi:MAG: serine protease [Marinifilum sp.]|jgi:S1-C subfamily serine protease|nr:serine protease [Marinifilum sp.]